MMNAQKTHWFRTTLIVLIICGILGTILAAVLFNDGTIRTCATAEIEFSFDGAADGVAPNGNRFDVNGIKNDEVLNNALEAVGMADRYTADEIRGHLVMTGIYPEDIVKQMMNYESVLNFNASRTMTVSKYYATQYSAVLYNDFDKKISQSDLEKLLKGIVEAYQKYFAKEYATKAGLIKNPYDLDNFDYPQQLTILTRMIQESAEFAQEMFEKEPTIRYNGYAFNDIAVRLNNLIESDINNLNAGITMNALTKNTKRLVTQYQYEIQTLNHELDKQKVRLSNIDMLLAAYEKNEIIYLSTADSLTKIDGNSSETYDSLVDERKMIADGITDINTQIAEYQMMLDDLLNGSKKATDVTANQTAEASTKEAENVQAEPAPDEAENIEIVEMTQEEVDEAVKSAEEAAARQKVILEKDIDALEAKRVAIMKDFESLLNTFNEQEINDLTVSVIRYDYYAPKILSGAFIKQVIKTAGPFCAVGFMVCMVLMIISRWKEEKARKAA